MKYFEKSNHNIPFITYDYTSLQVLFSEKICQKILSLKYTLKVIIILFAKLRIENDQLA
jgi:hypothetical protein